MATDNPDDLVPFADVRVVRSRTEVRHADHSIGNGDGWRHSGLVSMN